MTTSAEIRKESWRIMREGRWVWRYIAASLLLGLAVGAIDGVISEGIKGIGVQTWWDFLEARAKAVGSGLDLTVPSRQLAWQMTGVTLFSAFFFFILQGVMTLGITRFILRAAEDKREGWLRAAFGGFRYPLGGAALLFRVWVRVALWAIVFFPLAFVAIYRYCQCFLLKVEHPDWSSGKCLKTSARMMKGFKYARFALDCSYWKIITLFLMVVLVMVSLPLVWQCGLLSKGMMLAMVGMLTPSVLGLGLVMSVYMGIGQTRFYLERRDEAGVTEEGLGADADD